MISDALLMHLMFQMILLTVNLIGFTKIYWLSFMGLIGTITIAVSTITAFGDYYLMAVILLLINGTLPVFSVLQRRQK